jgi:hypothetical protein
MRGGGRVLDDERKKAAEKLPAIIELVERRLKVSDNLRRDNSQFEFSRLSASLDHTVQRLTVIAIAIGVASAVLGLVPDTAKEQVWSTVEQTVTAGVNRWPSPIEHLDRLSSRSDPSARSPDGQGAVTRSTEDPAGPTSPPERGRAHAATAPRPAAGSGP